MTYAIDPGYRYVELPAQPERRVRGEARHDRRVPGAWTGRIGLELQCVQPVHVGSGFLNYHEADDPGRFQVSQGAVSLDGRPVIPGSTLKGVVRSRYEAITKSCLLFALPKDVRADASGFEPCSCEKGRESEAILCPACALFGMMNLRARVSFEDAVAPAGVGFVAGELPEQFGPRPEKMVKDGQVRGRKLSRGRYRTEPPGDPKMLRVEAIPSRTQLEGAIRVWNLTDAELGGLLAALGVTPRSFLKVGRGKGVEGREPDPYGNEALPTGFGQVRATVDLSKLRSGERRGPGVEGLRTAFEEADDRFEAGEKGLVAAYQGDC